MESPDYKEWKKKLVSQRREHYKKLFFNDDNIDEGVFESLRNDAFSLLVGGVKEKMKDLMLEDVDYPSALYMAQQLLLSSDDDPSS